MKNHNQLGVTISTFELNLIEITKVSKNSNFSILSFSFSEYNQYWENVEYWLLFSSRAWAKRKRCLLFKRFNIRFQIHNQCQKTLFLLTAVLFKSLTFYDVCNYASKFGINEKVSKHLKQSYSTLPKSMEYIRYYIIYPYLNIMP